MPCPASRPFASSVDRVILDSHSGNMFFARMSIALKRFSESLRVLDMIAGNAEMIDL